MIKIISLFISILICYNLNAQVQDDYSDGDFTSNPTWSGDDTYFEVINNELHLNAPAAADKAYLSTSSSSISNTEWQVLIRLEFMTSNSNHARIYLVSDKSDLESSLNGYFIKIGGTEDEVSLYRQDGFTETEIIDGLDSRTNSNPISIRVKATRDNAGNWALFSDNTGGTSFVQEGTGSDNTYTTTSYFGIYCKYSSSRSKLFYFDDINASSCIASALPTTDFSTSNTNIGTGTSINFNDLSTQCPSTWAWTFNGASPSSSNLQHPSGITYSSSGTFDVSLTTTNTYGSHTETKTAYITVSSGSEPQASFTSSSASPYINQTITFTDQSTNNPTSWAWSISPASYSLVNGTTLNSQNIDVSFTSAGSYHITLAATNSFGSNSTTQIYYISDAPCDTLLLYDVPNHHVKQINQSAFNIDKIDNDGFNPPKYLIAIEVTIIPSATTNYWDVFSGADVYIELHEGDEVGNSVTPEWTSTYVSNTSFPVSWPYPTTYQLDTGIYTIKVWDEDPGFDDLISEILIDGGSNNTIYSDGNGTTIEITTSTNGITSGWWEQTMFDGTNYNTFLGATSWFYPYGQADNWLIMGPVTIPSTGATLSWRHMIKNNYYRDGYTVFMTENGNQINNFKFGGIVLMDILDNALSTDGDTIWKAQSISLDVNTWGGKDIYLAFNHNAYDQWHLFLDDIYIKDCSGTSTELIPDNYITNDFMIYPNPAKSLVNITIPEDFNNKHIDLSIFNVQGQLVRSYSKDFNKKVILKRDPSIKPGTYFIELRCGGKVKKAQLIFN